MYPLMGASYKIGKRVQLLAHKTALLPPPRDLAVEEVEEQAEGHEGQRDPEVARVLWSVEAVAHGELYAHDAAEAVHEGDQVGEVVGAHEGEVAGVLGVEEAGLLVLGCERMSVCVEGGWKLGADVLGSEAVSLAVLSTPLGMLFRFDMVSAFAQVLLWE